MIGERERICNIRPKTSALGTFTLCAISAHISKKRGRLARHTNSDDGPQLAREPGLRFGEGATRGIDIRYRAVPCRPLTGLQFFSKYERKVLGTGRSTEMPQKLPHSAGLERPGKPLGETREESIVVILLGCERHGTVARMAGAGDNDTVEKDESRRDSRGAATRSGRQPWTKDEMDDALGQ